MADTTLSPHYGADTTDPISRFDPALQPRLDRLAAESPRLAQLAGVHPYLFLALSSRTSPPDTQQISLERALNGEPLARVCEPMGIPLTLRHLPPEACFETPSPASWSGAAEKVFAAHMPAKPAVARRWLSSATIANHLCDERFALWVARQPEMYDGDKISPAALVALCVYAWHMQYGNAPSAVMSALRWTPRLALRTTIRRARHWQAYCALERTLPAGGVAPWIDRSVCNGYEFVPLNTAERLFIEAGGMKNCVMSYGETIAKGECRLFGIRRAGAHAATAEIRYIEDRGYLAITQIKGWANHKCPDEAAMTARDWIALHRHDKPFAATARSAETPPGAPDPLDAYRRAKAKARFGCTAIDWALIQAGLSSLAWRELLR